MSCEVLPQEKDSKVRKVVIVYQNLNEVCFCTVSRRVGNLLFRSKLLILLSDCEWFALAFVALNKRVTVSDSLRSLMIRATMSESLLISKRSMSVFCTWFEQITIKKRSVAHKKRVTGSESRSRLLFTKERQWGICSFSWVNCSLSLKKGAFCSKNRWANSKPWYVDGFEDARKSNEA